MVCNVIDECRCYAYSDVTDPKRYQFCGVRKGPYVSQCPADCCTGGCPGQTPDVNYREPFRIIKRPKFEDNFFNPKIPIFIILVLVTIAFLFYSYDLKIKPQKNV